MKLQVINQNGEVVKQITTVEHPECLCGPVDVEAMCGSGLYEVTERGLKIDLDVSLTPEEKEDLCWDFPDYIYLQHHELVEIRNTWEMMRDILTDEEIEEFEVTWAVMNEKLLLHFSIGVTQCILDEMRSLMFSVDAVEELSAFFEEDIAGQLYDFREDAFEDYTIEQEAYEEVCIWLDSELSKLHEALQLRIHGAKCGWHE